MSTIIEKYRSLYTQYVTSAKRFEGLLSQLLQSERMRIHFLESRAKSVDSFAAKIARPGKSYTNPLVELPDIIGVRIVLYYLDDVIRLGELLKREFQVIEEESSHQPKGYLPDQFGYLSMHYVVRLNNVRSKLPEWRECTDLHAEIQVRTVLQHAWAAVSHALQYKQEGDVPFDLRRRLFRLAGLFEIADEEFVSIRDTAAKIEKDVKTAFAEGSKELAIDAASIQEFIKQWKPLASIRKYAENLGYNFGPPDDDDFDEEPRQDSLGAVVRHCERLGIKTIGDLEKLFSYDPNRYLESIHDAGSDWYVSDDFIIYLLLIGARQSDFSVPILVQGGWHEDIASRVLKGANKHISNHAGRDRRT